MGTPVIIAILICIAAAEALSALLGADPPDIRTELAFMTALIAIGAALVVLDVALSPSVAIAPPLG